MAKVDFKNAIQLCPICCEEWHISLVYTGEAVLYKCLPFVFRSAPHLFNMVADTLEWILKNYFGRQHCFHYFSLLVPHLFLSLIRHAPTQPSRSSPKSLAPPLSFLFSVFNLTQLWVRPETYRAQIKAPVFHNLVANDHECTPVPCRQACFLPAR